MSTRTESERIAALEKGFKDAQAAAEANFDPMKGRTYIARMSPAMKRMIVEAIKKGRTKRAERKKAEEETRIQNLDGPDVTPSDSDIQGFRDYLGDIEKKVTDRKVKEQGFRDYLGDIEKRIERGEGGAPLEKIERLTSGTPRKELQRSNPSNMKSLSTPRNTLEERSIREGDSRIEYNPSRRDRRRSERGRREAREEQARYEAELDASLREDFPDLDLREEKTIRDRKLAERLGLIVPTSDPATSESIPGMGEEVDLSRVVESRPRKKRTTEQTMREYRKRLREEQEKELLRDYNYGGKILKKYRR